MAQNVTIAGVSYNDVPSIDIPKTGGGIVKFYDVSGISKEAATVAPSTSEQIVCASGVYTTGEQKVSAITPSIVGNLDASSFASSIVAAIEGKGVTVPDGTLLDGMAALIEAIEAGGGNSKFVSGSFTPDSDVNRFTVNHGLGEIPNVYAVWTYDIDGSQTVLTIKSIILLCPNITDATGYVGFSARCGSGSTRITVSFQSNGLNSVTTTTSNINGLTVSGSNETECAFSIFFGNTTHVYFHAGYTYKYLIGRCNIA